jgi:2-polyprenyl-3-methyl-5-hydroxy-6-metoxy-1,4-benzoquinol methylase
MPPSADVIRADFDRLAACAPAAVERLEPAVQRLVAEVPLRARVLEIGCGTGLLARELATKRGARVTAIDASPRMIDVARVRTPPSLGIEYCVADFLSLSPHGFDIVIATDSLRDLPLGDAATRMAEAVVAGGKVLIADQLTTAGLLGSLRQFAGVRQALRAALPNAAVRRHLGRRYSAIWTRTNP